MNKSFARRAASSAAALLAGACLLTVTPSDAGPPAGKARPMNIACVTTFEVNPADGSIDIEGVCQYTHLGRTTVSSVQTIVVGAGGVISIENDSVYTAANGDQLYAAASGEGHFTDATHVVFAGTETYHGGTGRFANASGSVDFTGGAAFTGPTTGTGHFAGSGGSISY